MLFYTKRKELLKIFKQFRKDALTRYGIEPDDSLETFLAFLSMAHLLNEEKTLELIKSEEFVHYNVIEEEYENNAD